MGFGSPRPAPSRQRGRRDGRRRPTGRPDDPTVQSPACRSPPPRRPVSKRLSFWLLSRYFDSVDEHEVYPNAPVVLVALEVRHPTAEQLARSELNLIKQRLGDQTPILRTSQMQTLQGVSGPSGSEQRLEIEQFPRFVDRTRTLSFSLRQTAMVIETTAYPGWDKFREIVKAALATRMAVSPVDAVERIGLRYIDEIRVPATDTEINWGDWVESTVLGPNPPDEVALPLVQWQGVGIYGSQPGHMMLMRYGPQAGYAVNFEGGDLRRGRPAEPGPFFLVDIDSFWTPEDGLPELDVDQVMTTVDEVHRPVRRLFESLATEKLRDEVFRK